MRTFLVLLGASALLCSTSNAQEKQPPAPEQQGATQEQQPAAPPPSLGEIARQLKLKKQQKEAQLKPAKDTPQEAPASDVTPTAAPTKTAHLITNDDSAELASVTPVSTRPASPDKTDPETASGDHQAKAEQWKSKILAQKNDIAALEQDIKNLGDSIHYAGANCVANCAQWNEKQQQKQQEVDTMKAQLEDAQKQLGEMQEAARKEGFGSSVYDP